MEVMGSLRHKIIVGPVLAGGDIGQDGNVLRSSEKGYHKNLIDVQRETEG